LAQQINTSTALLVSNLPISPWSLSLKFRESFANLALQWQALQLIFKGTHRFTLVFTFTRRLRAYNTHFAHPNELTQTRRQKLPRWFSSCVQPSTPGPEDPRGVWIQTP